MAKQPKPKTKTNDHVGKAPKKGTVRHKKAHLTDLQLILMGKGKYQSWPKLGTAARD